jgi:hypothetical protein
MQEEQEEEEEEEEEEEQQQQQQLGQMCRHILVSGPQFMSPLALEATARGTVARLVPCRHAPSTHPVVMKCTLLATTTPLLVVVHATRSGLT